MWDEDIENEEYERMTYDYDDQGYSSGQSSRYHKSSRRHTEDTMFSGSYQDDITDEYE